MGFIKFCLSWNVYSLPSFLETSYTGYRIHGWQDFLFVVSTLCYPTAFWLPWFLMRSQLLLLLGFPCKWCIIFLFLLSVFSCVWLLLFLPWCVCLWVLLSRCVGYCSSVTLGSIPLLFIFEYVFHLSFVSSGIPITFMMVYLMVSQISLRLCLFFTFFPFFSLYHLYWSVFWILLILSFASYNLLSSPSTKFLNFCYCTFQLQNFLKISFSLLISFIWYNIAIPSFSSLVKLFFSSMSIVIMVVLKLLLVKSCPSPPRPPAPPRLLLFKEAQFGDHPGIVVVPGRVLSHSFSDYYTNCWLIVLLFITVHWSINYTNKSNLIIVPLKKLFLSSVCYLWPQESCHLLGSLSQTNHLQSWLYFHWLSNSPRSFLYSLHYFWEGFRFKLLHALLQMKR